MTSITVQPGERTEITAAVDITGVGKTFIDPGGSIAEALRGIDLEIAEGEFVCILGASGCGKSTLLRLIAGFERPTSGTITVRSMPVRGSGPDRGVVFQDYGLFPWLTVAGNVAYGPRQRGVSRAEAGRGGGVPHRPCGREFQSWPGYLSQTRI